MTIRILAIETSCDETSAAVVEGTEYPEIKTNIIASQIDLHKITGGVVPEVAARAHCEQIIPVIEQALGGPIHKKIKIIDALAVTVGPGLVGSLLVGVETAKALAFATNKPLIPINHLEGHIFAALDAAQNQKLNIKSQNDKSKIKDYSKILNLKSILPALALIVSGGHTELVLIKDMFDYEIIGQTLDDAAGEAFDKVGTLLGLEYPCGPAISALADKVNSVEFKVNNSKLSTINYQLPRPMLHSKDLNFSFSGLKTAVVNLVKQFEGSCDGISSGTHLGGGGAKRDLLRGEKAAIAHEFQEAVVEVLVEKTTKAFFQNQKSKIKSQNDNAKFKIIKSILLTGGVSANKRLREAFKERFGDKLLVSPLELTGDNAGMIGLAAFYRYKKQIFNFQFSIFNKFSNSNDQKEIIESRIINPKSHFAWQNVDVDPNLEL